MARRTTPTLTEGELRLMRIVWELGEATVSAVMKALPKSTELAYNTVLTTMRILERKGYLSHEKAGRAHVYRPLISRSQARHTAIRHMVRNFFNDSPELLLLSVLEDETLSPTELKRLKEMIETG